MEYNKLEAWMLDELNYDSIPIENIVRDFAEHMITPTQKEFELALSFIEQFLENNSVRVLYGENMQEIREKTPRKVVQWLKDLWRNEKYEDFSYAVWFDKV